MKGLVLATVLGVQVLRLTTCGVTDEYANVTAVVTEVCTLETVTKTVASDAGGAAVGGALVGSLVGMPTAGAVVGAVSASEASPATEQKIVGCKFFARLPHERIEFVPPMVLDGVVSFETLYPTPNEDTVACALLKPGDSVVISLEQTENGRGEALNLYMWRRVHGGLVPS